MAGHPMRGGMQVPEKSKRGIGGVFRELLKFSPRLKLPMAVALLLAAAGTVLTIIGPNQLSRMTDLISDSLYGEIDMQAIGQVGEYEEIVVDLSGDLTERQLKLMQDYADSVIYICDGTMTGIRKFEKFCETIRVIEERKEVQIMNKIQLLYNRYSSKNSMQMEKLPVSLLGGIHRFENVSGRPLIDQIAKMDILRQVR